MFQLIFPASDARSGEDSLSIVMVGQCTCDTCDFHYLHPDLTLPPALQPGLTGVEPVLSRRVCCLETRVPNRRGFLLPVSDLHPAKRQRRAGVARKGVDNDPSR